MLGADLVKDRLVQPVFAAMGASNFLFSRTRRTFSLEGCGDSATLCTVGSFPADPKHREQERPSLTRVLRPRSLLVADERSSFGLKIRIVDP